MAALLLGTVLAYGQQQDSVYTALLGEEQALRAREDSLLGVIRSQRALLAADTTDRYDRSQAILRMEEAVFGLRNQLGVVASKINGIEQERILSDLFRPVEMPPTVSEPTTNEPNLIDNAYFRENLSPEEYRQLKDAIAGQPEIERLILDYQADYQALEYIAESYALARVQPVADSIYTQYRLRTALIRQKENTFRTLWGERYNQQVYLYSYLLDKLNRTTDLAALNEKNRDREVFDAERVISVAFASYPGQRALLTGYELALADALKLTAATDSLRHAVPTAPHLAFPKIELTEKEFVAYQDITFPEVLPYTVDNPVSELEIPEAGTYYSVTIGKFAQRQPVSTFRGAVPVAYRREGAQWHYFIGLFRTYGEAADAVQQLKEAGFRRPEAVRWKDLEYTNLASEAAENEGLFRVRIQTAGELPDEIREVLTRYARTKEITRVGDVFYVGTFTDRLQVDEVIQALERVGAEGVVVSE